MGKLEQYRQFVKQILTEHAQISTTTDTVKAELIFDNEHDHYQLTYVGWQGNKRVFGPVMHFDIKTVKFGFNIMVPKTLLPKG